jgi:hypothetical protein
MYKVILVLLISHISFNSCTKSQGEHAYSDHSYDFQLQDGTESHAYISHKPKAKDYPLVLFLQGAGCGTVEHIHTSSRRYFAESNAAILTIDKPGSYHNWKQIISMIHCSKEFLQNNYPSKRAKAIVSTLNRLKESDLSWNGELYIVAAHEGAYAAAYVSQSWDVKGLAILGTGEGFSDAKAFSDVSECLKQRKVNCNQYQSSSELISAALEDSTYPKINYRGISGTGIWWKELLSEKLSTLLKDYKNPTFIVHTSNDSTVEPGSAQRLNNNLIKYGNDSTEIKIYEGLDGGFMDSESRSKKHQVQLDVAAWIADQMKP